MVAPDCPEDDQLEPPPPVDTGLHALVLLPEMEPMVRSLERAIAKAQRRVHIECYIVKDDAFGLLLANWLIHAAQRGIDTKLLVDGLGSEEADPAYFERLRGLGVDTRVYRGSNAVVRNGTFFPRDHGRVFVVDDEAWTGGIAFREEWLPTMRGGKGWHDVCVQVRGPVVDDFVRVFETRWIEAFGDVDPCDVETGDAYSDLELVADCPKHATLVYDHYRRRIRRARTRVWIENSYFFPPPAMLQDLVDAAARGVDVRVMIPTDSDLKIVERAARSELATWIDHGIRIFEYQRCMNHAKIAVIDDDWCTVGTFNANPTSMGLANEVNLFVFAPAFVAKMAEHFVADLEFCEEVSAEGMRARPLLEQVRDRLNADLLNAGDVVFGPHDRGKPPGNVRRADGPEEPPRSRAAEELHRKSALKAEGDSRSEEPCRSSRS